MSVIFSKVLEMSLYGSIAILAVLLFRLVFKKCPKRILILFWIVVALRLVIPFNFNSPTSMLNVGRLFTSKSTAEETVVYDPENRIREITVVEDQTINETEPVTGVSDADASSDVEQPETATVVNETNTSKITFKTVVPYIWLSVTAGMLIFSAIRYFIFYSKAKWSSRSFDGKYYMANDIDSPFVVGIFNPKIFFPINMDDDEREYVLNHEWIHIKNKDSLTKLLSYVILCIHWFNPLVWLAFFMLCADIEMRVDEETTEHFNLDMVKEYCMSLVKHATDDNSSAFMQSTAFSGVGFGGMETKLRVTNLIRGKKSTKTFQILAIALTFPFVILISAASYEHEDKYFRKPTEPEASAMIESSMTEESTEPTETSSGPIWDDGFIVPYMELINFYESKHGFMTYSLIYVDSDLIPELVIDNTDPASHGYSDVISVYTYKNGDIQPVIEDFCYDSSKTEIYYYVPYNDILCQVVDKGNDVKEYYAYTLQEAMNGDEPGHSGERNPDYFMDGKSVTESEFVDVFRLDKLVFVSGTYSAEEAIALIKGEDITASTSETSGSDENTQPSESETSETETSETEPQGMKSFLNLPDFTAIRLVQSENGALYADTDQGFVNLFLSGKTLVININDYVTYQEFQVGSITCSSAHILKDYGKAYLYIQFYLDGNYPAICVFELLDTRTVFVSLYQDIRLESDIQNPRLFWCIESYGDNAITDIKRSYGMSSETGLPVPKDSMVAIFLIRRSLKCTMDLTGSVVVDGTITNEVVTFHAGDYVTPDRTDGKYYIDVKNNDGVVIRVDFTSMYNKYYIADNPRWLYLPIIEMFEVA